MPEVTTTSFPRWRRSAAGPVVLGVAVAVLVAGCSSSDDSGGDAAPTAGSSAAVPTATSSAPASGPATTPGATAQVAVNQSCVNALRDVRTANSAAGELIDAAGDLDAARIRDIVRTLQPLRRRLQTELDACRIVTQLPDGSTSTVAVPTTTPTS